MIAYAIVGYNIFEVVGSLVDDGDSFRVSKSSSDWIQSGSTISSKNAFITLDASYIRLEKLMLSDINLQQEKLKSCPIIDIKFYEDNIKGIKRELAGVRENDRKYLTRLK